MKPLLSAIAAAAATLAASSALAATLVNPTVTLSNTGLSQPTAITATHTTVTALASSEFILSFQLPAGFTKIVNTNQSNDCTGVTLKIDGVVQAGGNAPNCVVFTTGEVWVWTSVPVAGGATAEVHLDASHFRTPATPGVKTFLEFRTRKATGASVDAASPMPSVTIGAPPPPAPVPTMTEWAMILLTMVLGGFAALTVHKRRRTV